MKETIIIDNISVPIEGEKNVLALARKAGIEIPTFCYHSELSVYGACRLCLVDIEGTGIVTSCSTIPRDGMVVRTNTKEIRDIRKINLELILANHERECTSCLKNGACSLQTISRKLGIDKIRYKSTDKIEKLDVSSDSLLRDPNKCILCGDCVRFCDEIQSVGAIDFAFRGSQAQVLPSFGKDLADTECVNCGQCARVCPTGALVPKSEIDKVWTDIDNREKVVVAQIAPAIRVAMGEYFGMETGKITTGKVVAALKAIGFDKVYDTSFTADLTVIEEASEFISRAEKGEHLPQFTSCCPAWVRFAELYYPELLSNVSSCRSPQQMFGSLAKEMLPGKLEIAKKELSVISIMPCTAKKYEARRPEFATEGDRDVDFVLTTQELGRMIEEAGIDFERLKDESFDIPMGFNTGAGVIFGASGGVTEAVLRYAVEKVNNVVLENVDFEEARGTEGIREVEVELGGNKVKIAIVFGLANARKVCEDAKAGNSPYALIEVMACPGGCINGAGQPVSYDPEIIAKRGQSLYQVDKSMQLHKAQDNPYIEKAYKEVLGEIGGECAHKLLHTHYRNSRRISEEGMEIIAKSGDKSIEVGVCVGTNCFMKGSQDILKTVMANVEERGLEEHVHVKAAFCFEGCSGAPVVRVGDELMSKCSAETVLARLDEELSREGIK